MQQEIVISNSERLAETTQRLREGGTRKLHVLADFDRTLTTAFVDGKSVPSLISILRDGNYLTPDYSEKAHTLFDKYHPIEVDQSVSRVEKAKAMDEWWRAHFSLLIASGLKKSDLEKAVASGKVKLREGFAEFADFLQMRNIPLVIMSSSGLGSESIALYLKQAGKLYDNIHIICNEYEWDDEGKAVRVRDPIIHALNKYETAVQDYPAFEAIKDRKNVILLGDGIDDIGMVQGFDYDQLLTIGFLNDRIEENLIHYKKAFSVVLTGDASMEYVNELLGEIAE